jgi:small-conductance mechanosensitive channel
MEPYQQRIIETLVIVVLYLISKRFLSGIIDKNLSKRSLLKERGIITKRVVNVVLSLITILFIMLVWGVKQSELIVFIGSALTIVGIAFFAQWSLLSNITSSLILFFNHPIKINDEISIIETKDFVIQGRVTGIGIFFITLETQDGEQVTIPNNIFFIQKSIRKKRASDIKTLPED